MEASLKQVASCTLYLPLDVDILRIGAHLLFCSQSLHCLTSFRTFADSFFFRKLFVVKFSTVAKLQQLEKF